MKTYDINDQATFYFIIAKNPSGNEIIAWTDIKAYAQFYLKFHNCKRYHIRIVDKKYRDIVPILNENVNDEIELANINIKNNNKKYHYDIISIPVTVSELSILHDAEETHCAAIVDYANIDKYISVFKKKYQKAFEDIGLTDIIRFEIHGKHSRYVESLAIDQLRLLFRLFINHFD